MFILKGIILADEVVSLSIAIIQHSWVEFVRVMLKKSDRIIKPS